MRFSRRVLTFSLGLTLPCIALACVVAHADPIPVRRKQEPMHRTFLLKAQDGKVLATGEEAAVVDGDRVQSRLTFRFHDGSLDDEQSVFTQNGVFRLVSDHHIQKGPSFPNPVDIDVDVPSGRVIWHEWKSGRDVVHNDRLAMPSDMANGIMPLLVENFPPHAQDIRVSWAAIGLKPMIATIFVKPDGTQEIDPPAGPERTNEYTLHPELHGFVSLLAPLVNRVPGDIHLWVTDQPVPYFARLVGPFYAGAPIWTVEPAGPQTP